MTVMKEVSIRLNTVFTNTLKELATLYSCSQYSVASQKETTREIKAMARGFSVSRIKYEEFTKSKKPRPQFP